MGEFKLMMDTISPTISPLNFSEGKWVSSLKDLVVVIDDDVAKNLGFITSVETDEEATTLNLTGPSEINGCTAQRAGNFITDSGKDISGYVGNVAKENSPSILGYVRNGKVAKMIVFIDF